MLCLSGFELYSRWVPLNHILPSFLPYLVLLFGFGCVVLKSGFSQKTWYTFRERITI